MEDIRQAISNITGGPVSDNFKLMLDNGLARNKEQFLAISQRLEQFHHGFARVKPGIERALYMMGAADQIMNKLHEEKPELKSQVTCNRGCSACCHKYVNITDEEADLLAAFVRDNKVSADLDRLKTITSHSREEFEKLPYKERACIFLGYDGACAVYQVRPLVCRNLLVTSDPKHCNPQKPEDDNKVSYSINLDSELVTTAAFRLRPSGQLSNLMYERLSRQMPSSPKETTEDVPATPNDGSFPRLLWITAGLLVLLFLIWGNL